MLSAVPPTARTGTTASSEEGFQFAVAVSESRHDVAVVIGSRGALAGIGTTTTGAFHLPSRVAESTATVHHGGAAETGGLSAHAALAVLIIGFSTRAAAEYAYAAGTASAYARLGRGFGSRAVATGSVEIHENFDVSVALGLERKRVGSREHYLKVSR